MNSKLNAFRFTLGYAEKLVADIDDSQFAKQPHAGMNHPAWIIGHLAIGADFVAKLLGQPMLTDESWMAQFGPGSVVSSERAEYPSKEELMKKLRETYEGAIKILDEAEPASLQASNETPFFPEAFPTVGDLITHLITTHPAAHCGQLSAWRRCEGKGGVLGI